MELTGKEKRALRARGQTLEATVQVGREGVTDNLVKTLSEQFTRRDLIKIRLTADDRDELAAQIERLAAASGAAVAGVVGKTAVLHRPLPAGAPEPAPRRRR